ncbi:cytochrome b-c1 complex subunit 9 [Gorgonomyces haynaldii]|nr:cytochrome b-c1 complex subunit 9 [Gorgonomyces haynaldii]
MSLQKTIYNTFYRRASSYVGTIFVGAFLFEIAFDGLSDRLFDQANKGKQWKDIRDKYIQ